MRKIQSFGDAMMTEKDWQRAETISDSNQRQSDFNWGWNDAEEGRAPRCQRADYLRGWHAANKGR